MVSIKALKKITVLDAIFMVIIISLAIGIKLYFGQAKVADFDWLLFPVSKLVTIASGIPFLFTDSGYASFDGHFLINQSCAGIDFFILTCLVSVIGLYSVLSQNLFLKISQILGLWLISYLLTIVSNSARILMAIIFVKAENSGLWHIGASWTHYIVGIIIYFTTLIGFYFLIIRIKHEFTKSK